VGLVTRRAGLTGVDAVSGPTAVGLQHARGHHPPLWVLQPHCIEGASLVVDAERRGSAWVVASRGVEAISFSGAMGRVSLPSPKFWVSLTLLASQASLGSRPSPAEKATRT
jgi:hypothetical protein